MPRLTSRFYKSENLSFQYDVNIDKEGMFATTIPAEVVTKLKEVGIELKTNRLHNEGYFCSDTLEGLEKIVKVECDNYSKKELIEKKIILRYSLDTTCSYCKTKDGTLVPNERYANIIDGDYNWTNGTIETNYNNPQPFGFTCYVKPFKVIVWKFPDGRIQNIYELLNSEDSKDETIQWLTGLAGMTFHTKYKEIDYTPELGLFFKNIILYIFRINEQFLKVFGKEMDLTKVLSGNFLMLE
jgi:hypothetical protein